MSLTMLLMIGLILAFVSISATGIHFKTKLTFKTPLTAGGTVLIINIILIALTALGVFYIPFSTPLFIVFSPVVSVISWVYIKTSFQKPFLKRLFAILVGQSVYIALFFFFAYQNKTLEPRYPGEDTFMSGLGLLIGMAVCLIATIIGLITFLLPHSKRILK